MATAEVVRNAVIEAVTSSVVPLTSKTIQGSTQLYEVTSNSQLAASPIFFAPSPGLGQTAVYSYWDDLFRGTVSGVYAFVPTEGRAPMFAFGFRKVSLAWDRLSLELMRLASLGPNWDGEAAEAITQKSVSTAGILLLLAKDATQRSTALACSLPTLFPSVEGGITFKWARKGKELKCTVLEDVVEVIRWKSSERYESDGLWELPVQGVAEHFEWLMR